MKKSTTIIYQLTRPFAYLQIKHEDKWLYDWAIPCIFTCLSLAFLFFLSGLEQVVGDNGLLSSILGFTGNLPGFFIAALAAIATFNRKDIDQLVSGKKAEVKILNSNQFINIQLTRRRLLCLLFAFLTTESLLINLYGHFGLAVTLNSEPQLTTIAIGDQSINMNLGAVASWGYVTFFMFMLWQMITSTMFGLYYLGDKLHQIS
ncbi:hypothetical protein [Endozoicomonas sp. Mp262]|uniref:hypothetical protein n=1 Tax=Endozoicomonas sp. Mp262 TaxID=2919499 RepID=UPI0021D8F722